jgi:ABC-type nickel/cobalt efflux system permease component RcnA
VFLILAALTVASLAATACLLRSDNFTDTQKALQLILVWLVPLLGATFVLSVWAHDRQSESHGHSRSEDATQWLPGIGHMSDTSHPASTFGDVSTHDGQGRDT